MLGKVGLGGASGAQPYVVVAKAYFTREGIDRQMMDKVLKVL